MSRVEQFVLGSGRGRAAIHVGLVNNMPDAALRATELRFARLLKDAAGPLDVRLRLFSLGGIARSDEMRARMTGFYDDAAFLQASQLDALIFAGPGTDGDPRAETWWPELAHLVDWAEIGTISALFSGQAANAALLHLDGILPRRLPAKKTGIYRSQRAEDDPLFFGLKREALVPHERRSAIAQGDLGAHGYRVLARLEDGSADIFTREPAGHSRFVFLQGHPEYEPDALGRSYLAAMARFLAGESAQRPAVPENYFDRVTEQMLADLAANAPLARHAEIVSTALPRQSWRDGSVRLFANWLALIATAKTRRTASRAVHTRRRAS